MGTYRVAHGTVKQNKKLFKGDKSKPGKGDSLELDDKAAAHLIAAGVLEKPVAAAVESKGETKPDGKGK